MNKLKISTRLMPTGLHGLPGEAKFMSSAEPGLVSSLAHSDTVNQFIIVRKYTCF
jgi:hypothetical protein